MKIVNAEECCEGLWTRVEGIQKSVLDYILVFEKDTKLVNRMRIDEEKDITPYYVEKTEGKEERKYTDHYMITAMMNISMKETCKKYVNILNEEGWAKFREELQKEKVSEITSHKNTRQM